MVFQESQSSAFYIQPVLVFLSLKLPSSTWVGALYFLWNSEICINCYAHSLSRNQDQASCYTVYCFFLHFLTLRISNWICPLELRKGLGGWNLFLTNKKQGHRKALMLWKSTQGPARFQSPLLFDSPRLWGEQVLEKEVKKFLDREVNQKLGRGTVLGGCSFTNTRHRKKKKKWGKCEKISQRNKYLNIVTLSIKSYIAY